MLKRIISMCIVLIMIIGCVPVMANDEPYGYAARQLTVVGNRVAYADDLNANVRLVGANIPSLGWGKPGDKEEHIYESLTETLEGWNSNLIRLPIIPSRWFDTSASAETYKKWIDDMVKGCRARGKYIIIDCHTYRMPTQIVFDLWMELCDIYGNDPSVLFGLCNEPHGIVGVDDDAGRGSWDIWRHGGIIDNDGDLSNGYVPTVAIGHQNLVEAIRDKGAKNILVAGGLSWGYDLRGIAGMASDGISYALIDQGTNNDMAKKGNGIIYDSHIYPNKGQTSNYDAAAGCVRSFAPILIGEFGWDAGDATVTGNNPSVYNVWMPQLMDWIDDTDGKYGMPAHWTAWNVHPSSTPRVITGWDFNPTSYLGVYVKERLLSYPSNNTPVSGTYTNTFSPDVFRAYEKVNAGSGHSLSTAITDGALKITYNRTATTTALASKALIPVDWVLTGMQTLEFDLQGDAQSIGAALKIGFEGADTEVWTKDVSITDTNKTRIVIPINQLQKQGNPNCDGILNAAIRSVYFGFTNTSKGVLTVSNLQITKSANPTIPFPPANPYVKANPSYLVDMETDQTKITVTKNDKGPGGSLGDYFTTTVEDGIGLDGGKGIKVDYQRTEALWGGFSQASWPTGTDWSDANYFSLCIRGDGVAPQLAEIKIGKGNMAITIPADTTWRQYTFRLQDINLILPTSVTNIQFHAGTKMAGIYYVDNLVISSEKPADYVPFVPRAVENGFEDTLVTWSTIAGDAGDTITGKIVDGGFNTQRSYRLTYTRGSGTAAIAQGVFPVWDMTNLSRFTFDARAEEGTAESINIKLLDKIGVAAVLSAPITLTDQWQRFELDLEDFMLGYDFIQPTRIKGIQISSATNNHSGQIYIDNLTFSNSEVEKPVAFGAKYINSFDNDVYAQNGGVWTAVGDTGTVYFRGSVEADKGYVGKGLEFTMAGLNTGKRADLTGGFPSDWDFTKVKFASMMVKGTNVPASDGKMQNLNKFTIDLYYDYTDNGGSPKSIKTGTFNLDATANTWSHVIVPIVPNASATPAQVKATNRMSVYSTLSQNGGFIIDDLMFCDMKPEPIMPVEPATYLECFDSNTVFDLRGGYYNSADDYLFRKDNGRVHWGRSMQYILPPVPAPNNSAQTVYMYANMPVSWTIERNTHFVFEGKLMQTNEWVGKDYDLLYGSLATAVTRMNMRVALVDIDGVEYSQELLITNNSTWIEHKMPLEDFVSADGKQPVWRNIVQLRMYPDTSVGQAGIRMDNMGFKTYEITYDMSVTGITATVGTHNLVTDGLTAGEATITTSFSGKGKQATVAVALYRKSDGALYAVRHVTKNVQNDPDPTSISVNIDIPENADDYTLRAFTWDSLSRTAKPYPGENATLIID